MSFHPLRHFLVSSSISGVHSSSVRAKTASTRTRLLKTIMGSIVNKVGHNKRGSDYYRQSDGVRITHDPYAPGMAEKYGAPGKTDNEGFDPYADSVGPGIYGGRVKRDPRTGEIVIGKQYQNHNPRPGPVYAGGGYAPIAEALSNFAPYHLKQYNSPQAADQHRLVYLLRKYPDLVNDVTTGGAQPLHMCGMSQRNQAAVLPLVLFGADLEALDTYGMTPLHRMASNNLPEGARWLLEAGADPENRGQIGQTALAVARESRAGDFLKVLHEFMKNRNNNFPLAEEDPRRITHLIVQNADFEAVNGVYLAQPASQIPTGFDCVCKEQNWNTNMLWKRLNSNKPWFLAKSNESYIYLNESDGKWWIDGPDGMGAYTSDPAIHQGLSKMWKENLGVIVGPPAYGWTDIRNGGNNGSGRKGRLPVMQTMRENMFAEHGKNMIGHARRNVEAL